MAVLRLKQSPRSATSRRRVSESNIRSLGAADGRDPRPNLDDFDSAALACGNQPTREPHGIVRATVENGLDLPSDAIDRRKDSHLGLGGRRMAFQILERYRAAKAVDDAADDRQTEAGTLNEARGAAPLRLVT